MSTLNEPLYSVEDAAKKLGGVSKWTVRAWLGKGKLQRTKVGGRTMIRESELEKFVQDGGKSPAPRRASEVHAPDTDARFSLLDFMHMHINLVAAVYQTNAIHDPDGVIAKLIEDHSRGICLAKGKE